MLPVVAVMAVSYCLWNLCGVPWEYRGCVSGHGRRPHLLILGGRVPADLRGPRSALVVVVVVVVVVLL